MAPRRQQEVQKLSVGENFKFAEFTTGLRVTVEWLSANGIICDLDLHVYFYDERARFIEKLNFDHPTSTDGSSTLVADVDSHAVTSSHQENVHIDFHKIDPATSAILLFIDGGPRNFQYANQIIAHVTQENVDNDDAHFLPMESAGGVQNPLLFQIVGRTRKDVQGVALGVFYKDGWHSSGATCWSMQNLFEPVYVPSAREKDEKCANVIINAVPALDKYRPRLFANVKAICAALSSTSLPKLKKSFLKFNGLPIKQFTEVLFAQLYETHPKIIEESEAAYTVAMLEDMFSQIDFNGDGTVDWEEFTNFCIHTGLVGTVSLASGMSDGPAPTPGLDSDALDDYVIHYNEDANIKDHVINSYARITVMRYLTMHDGNRIMVVQEKSDIIHMVNETFNPVAELDIKTLTGVAHPEKEEKPTVYDAIYLPSKDMFAYCSSDHTIVLCKEQTGRRKIYYSLHNRIYHNVLHVKLCWSDANKLLCSVGANNDIYGWDLDGSTPLFQVNRHSDLVTDFIAIDRLDLFVTCSLDRRIVLWSMTSRRVKGVLQGHKRGVRCLSYAKDVLLSAGFECEAKTWDLSIKEPTLILRGHRYPIAAVKMMCAKDQTDDNLRAITVDDSGEFRLWNVFVKERGGGQALAPTLQTFYMHSHDSQMTKVNFIELPFNAQYSKGNYSNLIAASVKLTHFTPEKSSKEFIPPTFTIFNDASACIVTTIGKSVFKYDICNGHFISQLNALHTSDLTCMCLDGDFGRRMYVGTNGGVVMLINFATGAVIDSLQAHAKEVSCIVAINSMRNTVFTGSLDGRIRIVEEISGALAVHNTAENALGDMCGVNNLKACEGLGVLVASSTGSAWGIWNISTLKKLFILQEEQPISSLAVIASTGDDIVQGSQAQDKEQIITIAIAVAACVRIYTVDIVEVRASVSFVLEHTVPKYIASMTILNCTHSNAINYSMGREAYASQLGMRILAVTDEGDVIAWDGNIVKKKSLEIHRSFYAHVEDSKTRNNRRFSQIALRSTDSVGAIAPVTSVEQSAVTTSTNSAASSPKHAKDLKNKTSPKAAHKKQIKERRDSEMSNSSNASFDFFDAVDTRVESKDSNDSTVQPLMRTLSCVSLYEVCKNVIEGESSIIPLMSYKSWRAHSDVISSIVPLDEHGCVVTVSLDGYHRVWNMDGDCLGEMSLPNLTDKMKQSRILKDELQNWKFILERIPVSKHHRTVAQHLVGLILGTVTNEDVIINERRKATVNPLLQTSKSRASLLPALSPVKADDIQRAKTRVSVLKKLRNSNSMDDDDYSSVSSLSLQSNVARPQSTKKHDGLSAVKLEQLKDMPLPPDLSTPLLTPAGKPPRMAGSDYSSQGSPVWKHGAHMTAVSSAFSVGSLRQGQNQGILDGESHTILRRVGRNPGKVEAYSRQVPEVLLKDIATSTKVIVPPMAEIDTSEDMYANANKLIKHSNRMTKAQARHAVSMARLKQSIRLAGELVHIAPTRLPDAVALPPMLPTQRDTDDGDSDAQSVASAENLKHKLRQSALMQKLQEEKRVIDQEKVRKLMDKVNDAMVNGLSEVEMRGVLKHELKEKKRQSLQRLDSTSPSVILERKVINAIKSHFRCEGGDGNSSKRTPVVLNTRMLLPSYKLADVQHFLNIFQKVDEDYSGDLDPTEWVKFLTTLNKSITQQQARSIFMQVDKNHNGVLSIRDLIPVVFSKANKETLRHIIKYVDSETLKKKNGNKDACTEKDLEKLFEVYDVDVVGFVSISLLRDKIRGMQLMEEAQFMLLSSMQDMEDDEMLNMSEFTRIFKPFIT